MKRFAIFTAMALAAAGYAVAQVYPQRPITFVVPYTPGGSSDIMTRIVQEKLSVRLGQPVIVDNRPGATGNVGGAFVANAKPDGYTLLVQSTVIGMFPHVLPSMPYDPIKGFAMVGTIAESPTIIAVNAASKLRSMADMVMAAKQKPGGLNIGTGGAGSPAHLVAEQMAKLNGFKVTHIAYRGTAPAVNDLLAGTLDAVSVSIGAIQPQLISGNARAIVIASPNRSALGPDVQTTKDAGFASMNGGVRYFLGAPAATPRPIIDRLSRELDLVLQDPAIAFVECLQVLQLLEMKVVDVRPVGFGVDPILIGLHIELVVEERRAHRFAHHRHALL